MLVSRAIALLVTTAAATVAQPATAAAPIVVTVPAKVVVQHAYENVPWQLSGVPWDTDPYTFQACSVTLEDQATRNQATFDTMTDASDATDDGVLQVYDWMVRPGPQQVIADCMDDGQATAQLVMKWGSRAGITSAKRVGKYVTVKAKVRRWDKLGSSFAAWKYAPVQLQRRVSGTWRVSRYLKSNSYGIVNNRLKVGRSTWRIVVPETSSTWSATSTAVTR
jgi:hypothetical protein